MTLADYILSKSTLPSGTIFDHILAMQTGGGQGAVFASMFSVSVEQQSVVVTRQRLHEDLTHNRDAIRPTKPYPAPSKGVNVFTQTENASATSGLDQVTIFTGVSRSTVTTRLDAVSVARKLSHDAIK